MDHDIGIGLHGLGLIFVTIGRSSVIHLHVIGALLHGLWLLVRLSFALFLEVDLFATRLRSDILLGGWSRGILSTSHLRIFTLRRGRTLSLNFFLLFLAFFLDAVLVAVRV